MKCTNCGNDNPATLWDEGDTIYCSVCTHRTRKTDFEDDSVQCPYCHRLRDKKAMYCRYCNSSDWTPSSPAECAEIDKILKDMGYQKLKYSHQWREFYPKNCHWKVVL